MSADFISFNVNCPHCGVSFMNSYQPIHEKPSIRLKIKRGEDEGIIRLCSIYGCYEHVSDIELVKDEIYEFYCPNCGQKLNIEEKCESCNAPLVSMKLSMGGKVQICSRSGCTNHLVAFKDLTTALNNLYEQFGYGSPSVD